MGIRNLCLFALLGLVILVTGAFSATRQMENLDRGVVAVKVTNGVFVSWRLLGTEAPDTQFKLYRGTTLVYTTTGMAGTNYTDASGTTSSTYSVSVVVNGAEGAKSKEVSVWATPYKTLKLDRPAALTMPDYSTCNYSPNDMSVGDLDGDGELELVVKWDPNNSQDNSKSGYTGNVYIDAYKLNGTKMWRIDLGRNIRAGAHYTQFMVYDLDGDGIAEVAMKTSDGTTDGVGTVIGSSSADYRTTSGIIMSGNEYLTVFNGTTGAAITTIDYLPARTVQAMTKAGWGDDYANRSERMLAAIAYLDGVHPSLVMCRGYYTAAYLVAYDFNGSSLTQRWYYKSETSGSGLYGQGNHNLSVGDLDGDGYDEIVYGAAALNHDGTLRYRTGLGHGDAIHLSDMNPDHAGLEVWDVHEEKGASYGYELRSQDGSVLFGRKTGTDNGRGLAADIDSTHRGFEMWSSSGAGVYNVNGDSISANKPSINFRIYWDGDLYDELLDGTKLDKWTGNGTTRLLTIYNFNNSSSINSTKANPNLTADLFGDWREEVIEFSAGDSASINIFTTTTPSPYRVYTLMHNSQYRTDVARENVAYNQPPHLGYYLPDAVKNGIPQPDIYVSGGTAPLLSVSGSATQSILLGRAISTITYTYKNCTSASATGLPAGVTATVNNGTLTIRGTPTEHGTFAYTVTTVGGEGTVATKTGTITVSNIVTKLDASVPTSGDGITESTNSGYEVGSGYYNFTNTLGSTALWTIYSTSARTVTLFLHYSNGTVASADRALALAMNGSTVDTLNFVATANWTTWDLVSVTITLAAGVNTISLTSLTANGGANIDYFGFDADGIFLGSEFPIVISQERPNLHAYWASANVFVAPSTGVLTLRIFDIRGNSIAQKKMNVHAGNNQISMRKAGAGFGVYWVKAEWNGVSVGMIQTVLME